jgi:hypothetical protein
MYRYMNSNRVSEKFLDRHPMLHYVAESSPGTCGIREKRRGLVVHVRLYQKMHERSLACFKSTFNHIYLASHHKFHHMHEAIL